MYYCLICISEKILLPSNDSILVISITCKTALAKLSGSMEKTEVKQEADVGGEQSTDGSEICGGVNMFGESGGGGGMVESASRSAKISSKDGGV